jgi:hypothetical protein
MNQVLVSRYFWAREETKVGSFKAKGFYESVSRVVQSTEMKAKQR